MSDLLQAASPCHAHTAGFSGPGTLHVQASSQLQVGLSPPRVRPPPPSTAATPPTPMILTLLGQLGVFTHARSNAAVMQKAQGAAWLGMPPTAAPWRVRGGSASRCPSPHHTQPGQLLVHPSPHPLAPDALAQPAIRQPSAIKLASRPLPLPTPRLLLPARPLPSPPALSAIQHHRETAEGVAAAPLVRQPLAATAPRSKGVWTVRKWVQQPVLRPV